MPSATQNNNPQNPHDKGAASEMSDSLDYEDFDDELGFSIESIFPPMMIVLAASLIVVFSLLAAAIYGIRRRGNRQRKERGMEQVKILMKI